MKKMIVSAALVMASAAAMAQKANFQLKAEMKNFATDTVLVYKGRDVKMDTLMSKAGKFTYSATLEKPAEYTFCTPGAMRGKERNMFSLVCVPGEKAELKGDLTSRWDVTGSKYYQQYHEVDLMLEAASKDFNDLRKTLSEKMKNGGDRNAIMAEYEQKAPALEKAKNEKILAFVAQHPDYEACATLVNEFADMESMDKVVSTLSEQVRNGRMKAFYEPVVKRAKARAEAEEKAKKVQAAGVEAPDFTLKDIKGNDFTLSSLRGKYVVLDFWGSWCGWCIKGMPEMKKYYEKYKGKFEIVGIDCNDTDAKWKAAVEKHQLPWLHVYNPREGGITGKYAIQGYPTKIVVGPDGKIVKTITGEDPAFYTLLDEVLGK